MLITSWKCGAPPSKHRETTGKTAGKPVSNRWKTAGKLSGKPVSNRWKTAGKLSGKPASNRWKATGRPLAKLSENRREKPRFWVTFDSLNKRLEGPGRASPASFFGPWGGLP